jgi:EAL domain-containing protein (putative c-di-GMP-specific phosphodiesterase class I)
MYYPGSGIERQIEHNFKWQNILKDACENNKFIPYFQPILNIASGKIEKYECLIRIKDADDIIEPGLFIDAAKESGLLSLITRTVMAQSFLAFKDNDYDFSVNITEDDLQDETFTTFVKHKLNYYNIRPNRVYFEILEGIGTNIVSESLETLRKLKALGCSLAADDFGTGHSNFHRMLELDIDLIKIDGSFIKNIEENETSRKIVAAIVGFARAIDAKVVAEFVSSSSIYDIIKNMGIDYAQGYYIGIPRPQICVTGESI